MHRPAFAGHAGVQASGPMRIAQMAAQIADYITAHHLAPARIFGYSMGGYVGLHLARHRPELVAKLATLATKLDWRPEVAEKEARMLDADKIIAKVPAYAEVLRERHAPLDWRAVLAATAEMMIQLGQQPALTAADWAQITTHVHMCVGDQDNMVSIAETEAVQQAIPGAQLQVLAGVQHPIERVPLAMLLDLVAGLA